MLYGSASYPTTLSEMENAPHVPLGAVLLQNLPALSSLGLKDPLEQLLGRGAFGAAYEIPLGGKSVLKITRDATEMQAAHLLLGKRPQRIVHVYGLWAIPKTHERGLQGWYAVHRQYLTPLSKRDARLVDAIFEVYGDMTLDLMLCRQSNYAMMDKWRGYLREELMEGESPVPLDDEGARVSVLGGGRMLSRAMELLGRIGDAVAEMHKIGVDWEDIHSGNLMRNDAGQLVIADIGFGEVHKKFRERATFLTKAAVEAHVAAFSQPSVAEGRAH